MLIAQQRGGVSVPDPNRQSISASQMAGLFNSSPYMTRWQLWHHFKNNAPLPEPDDERVEWGTDLQEVILKRTAKKYRVEIKSNLQANEYVRRGLIGHTRDGLTHAADVGPILVEAKNIDFFRWKETWTETAAAQHVEIQLQTGMYCDQAGRGIIAALVGGNDLRFYERAPNVEFQKRLEQEAEIFFDSITKNEEPPLTAPPVPLPMLAYLYPESHPEVTLTDLENKALRELLRECQYARDQIAYLTPIADQRKAQILAIAKTAGRVIANSIELKITKSPTAESVVPKDELVESARDVLAWATAKWGRMGMAEPFVKLEALMKAPYRVARKASIATRFTFADRPNDPPLKDDPLEQALKRK